MKWVFRSIPYAFVVMFIFAQAELAQFDANYLYTDGRSAPNEATGEVWRIVFRDGAARYTTIHDYAMYWAPFIVVPGFIISILWIITDLWKAGFFDQDNS